jgi:hypothetical protein
MARVALGRSLEQEISVAVSPFSELNFNDLEDLDPSIIDCEFI